MINSLKEINKKLISQYQNDDVMLRRQILIKNILEEEKAFFKISIEESYSILKDLMIPDASLKDVYSKLIDVSNYIDKEVFKYEVPSPQRKEDAISFIKEFKDYNSLINGTGGLDRFLDNYEGWLIKLEEDYNRIPNEEKVPAKTYFLVRCNDNKIVGMANIRLALNEKLKKHSGNIGYSIRPTERRKGYNKINLYLALKECSKHNIKEVMLDCDKENVASSKTIESLGGKLVKEYFDHEINHVLTKVYTIDVQKSLESNKKYESYIEE